MITTVKKVGKLELYSIFIGEPVVGAVLRAWRRRRAVGWDIVAVYITDVTCGLKSSKFVGTKNKYIPLSL